MTNRGWSPANMPRMRDDLVRIYVRPLVLFAPPDDGIDVVAEVVRHRITAIAEAALWWVSPAMTALALEASATLPDWTPFLAPPTPAGLLAWEDGLPPLPWPAAPEEHWTTSPLGERVPPLVSVDGMSWSTHGEKIEVDLLTRADQDPIREIYASWERDSGVLFPFDYSDIKGPESPAFFGDTAWSEAVVSTIGATWILMQQSNVAELDHCPVDDALGETSVRVVNVRRAPQPGGHNQTPGPRWMRRPDDPEAIAPRRPFWVVPDHARSFAAEQIKVWRR